MGRMVICPFDGLSVTADATQDIWELTAGANDKLKLHGFELYSAAIAAEILDLRLVRYATSGSAGGTGTEVLLDQSDGSITAAVETLNTTPGGTPIILMGFQWEQLGPLIYLPIPEDRIVVQEAGIIALNLQTAPTAVAMSGHVIWEEI